MTIKLTRMLLDALRSLFLRIHGLRWSDIASFIGCVLISLSHYHYYNFFSDYSLLYYFSIWFCLIALSLGYIFSHGVDYVSWPQLNPQTEAIYYTGPGYRSGRNGLGQVMKHGGAKSNRPRANSRLGEAEMGSLKKRND
jgi:hypothetical protein